MNKITIELADKKDDLALRQLINSIPIAGKVSLLFKKEPCFFSAINILAQSNQIGVAKNSQNSIIGLGIRSIKTVYINGLIKNIGYLSNLRLKQEHRGGILLAKAYKFLKTLHQDNQVQFYLTTIIDDNNSAKKLLTSKRAGLPRYHDFGLYYTYLLMIGKKRKKVNNHINIQVPDKSNLEELFQFINSVGSKKQFFPHYTPEDLIKNDNVMQGIKIDNFRVARRDGQIVGTLAIWNQSQFKQTIVHSYNSGMKIFQPLYNIYAKAMKLPFLPKAGNAIPMFYIAIIAIKNNDKEVFKALLTNIYNSMLESGYLYFAVGLHEKDSLNQIPKLFRHSLLKSRLYLASWPEDKMQMNDLDKKVPYLELGAL